MADTTTLQEPVFVDTDPKKIIQESRAYYESLTGLSLNEAQAEALMINVVAYREFAARAAFQEGAKQMLINYSRGAALDELAAFLGVKRLAAAPAETTFSFTLIPGHGADVIPQGTRIGSPDGNLVFITKENRVVQVSDASVNIPAACSAPGKGANGYDAGAIWSLLDPIPYVDSVETVSVTAGGSDEESDEELRARFKLAPSAFSTAGPTGAYIYHAKSAHPSIIDVGVVSLVPGTVNVFPLVDGGGEPSEEVINAVYNALSDEKVRPLNDTVVVGVPEAVEYSIVVNLTLKPTASINTTQNTVLTNLTQYAQEGGAVLGSDRIKEQIIALSQIPGVYKASVVQPESDVIVSPISYAKCTNISVTVTGFSEG